MVVIAIFRVIKAPFIDGNLSIIDCYAEAVHVFRNFVHVIKNRLVGAPVHVIEKTVHVHENCCSRVLRILIEPAFLLHILAGVLNGALDGRRHVLHLQVLDVHAAVLLRERMRRLPVEILSNATNLSI